MGLTVERPQPVYPCSQQDLYTIIETGWESFSERLPAFMDFKTTYSATTRTDQLLALTTARSMPDEESRDEVHKTLRVQMIPLAETCIKKWSDMMSYVRDGFPEEEYDGKRLAAGYGYYAGAEKRDWEDVKGLAQSGLDFLNKAENATPLNDGGMPANFVTGFAAAKTAFETKYQAFLQAEELSKELTDAKIQANNDLYKALTKMFEDGKKIFRDNAAVRDQFTFDTVWGLVKGHGGGSNAVPADMIEIGAYMFDAETLVPIVGGVLRVLNPPSGGAVEAVTGNDGILQLKVSGYAPNATVMVDFEGSAAGYELQTGSVEMTAGNAYSFEIQMTAIPVQP